MFKQQLIIRMVMEMERNFGYNRNNSYLNRYSPKKPRQNKGTGKFDRKRIEKIANQLIVSGIICLIVITLSNFDNQFINKVVHGARWVVVTDYDFKAAAANLQAMIPGIGSNLNNLPGTVDSLMGKTDTVDVMSSGASLMIMPVDGIITSGFGTRQDPITQKTAEHWGIDIDGEIGEPIKAAMEGTVVKIEESKSLGRSVILKHSDGIETLYGHCSEILVDENQTVEKGDYIAKVGDTGEVTSAHLHFEVRRDGKLIDPLSMMEGIKELK